MNDLERAVQRVLGAGLSTGHADSWDQLLDEVIDQAMESRRHEELVMAFVQGAKWWEHDQTNATMWAADVDKAESAAQELLDRGRLGKAPEVGKPSEED